MFCRYRAILILLIVLLLSVFLPNLSKALKKRSAQIKVPENTAIQAPDSVVLQKLTPVEYRLYFGKSTVFPLELVFSDFFGAHIRLFVKDPTLLKDLEIKTGRVMNPRANPFTIYTLPALCPRVEFRGEGDNLRLVYMAKQDIVNERPSVQLFDRDLRYHSIQKNILKSFDDKNTLRVQRIKLSYDFEDDTIVDFQGPHPIHHTPHLVYEGQGGFYANLHYAVVPYDDRINNLNRQELLNLAQGKLDYIDRKDLLPPIRTHSFLPGPYLSGQQLYPLCEWGDTAFQSSIQELYYEDLKIWDWDLKDEKGKTYDHVMIIVWEGDEEDWLISDGLLDPYYLTDDVVGVFEAKRKDTLKGLKLVNTEGNFEMDVVTE